MEKKRTLLVNVLAVGAVLVLVAAMLLVSRLIPRKVVPNAGQLEIVFEPAMTMQAPANGTN